MTTRTDLALECKERLGKEIEGIDSDVINFENIKITRMHIQTDRAEQVLKKPKGHYTTVEVLPFTDSPADEAAINSIKTELIRMIPKQCSVLVVGLGNTSITPDAFGPKAAAGIIATRHIESEVSKSVGLGDLRGVSVLAPGVLGQTGIETVEIIKGIVDKVNPGCVICLDSLASCNLSRLGCTVQMCDTGISPGEGVGNRRTKISQESLGVPVIAIGVPTVVDAVTLANELTGRDCTERVEPRGAQMVVTPKEIDLLIDRAAKAVSLAINSALQPHLKMSVIAELV